MQKLFKIIFVLFLVSTLTSNFTYGQEPHVKKDSKKLYENIEAYAGRSRFTRFMYRLFFKPVVTVPVKKGTRKKPYKKLIQKPYSTFEGKTIRFIHIETLDPFGYSIGDTIKSYPSFISRAGNRLHIKSQPITIRNLLLIRQNQPFDSLLVKESERLVRSRKYVTDVSFFVKATARNSDSVDIFIRELDNWSIIPGGEVTDSRITFNLTDKNFTGLGHEYQNEITWHHTNGGFAFNTNYFIPNIRNTYINSTLHYGTDEYGNFIKNVAIDRPFFSPFAKWAAGVNFTQQFRKDSVYTTDSNFVLQRFKFNAQDYWAGYAIQLFKGRSEESRTTNFISTFRLLRIRYLEKPDETTMLQPLYSDQNFYLASIGISKRKYLQDKYIFKYGVTEDVPVGKVYSLTGGYQKKNNTGRFYLGGRVSFGNYYSWGYLSTNYEFGTFIHASHAEEGILSVGINYFTGLREIGKWKFRQFVKPQITIGINRLSADSLTLNDNYGIEGFNSPLLSGTSRMLLTFQTQSYSPWNFIGFRFGPFFNCTIGMLGDEASGFKKSRVYSQIGLGVLLKNESLVINTLQISISFYPMIPGKGQNMFKINSFGTGDFGYGNFEIGKPASIAFH